MVWELGFKLWHVHPESVFCSDSQTSPGLTMEGRALLGTTAGVSALPALGSTLSGHAGADVKEGDFF